MNKDVEFETKRPGFDPERARHIREMFRRLTRPRPRGKVYNPGISPARPKPKPW